MKATTIRRHFAIHYAKLPGGYVEAAIWNRVSNEPVWVERETARAEIEAICNYIISRHSA